MLYWAVLDCKEVCRRRWLSRWRLRIRRTLRKSESQCLIVSAWHDGHFSFISYNLSMQLECNEWPHLNKHTNFGARYDGTKPSEQCGHNPTGVSAKNGLIYGKWGHWMRHSYFWVIFLPVPWPVIVIGQYATAGGIRLKADTNSKLMGVLEAWTPWWQTVLKT